MTSTRLLVVHEVAALLRVSRSTVAEWSRRGLLPSVVLSRGRGRSVRRWRAADVEAFIERGAEEAVR